MANPNPGSQPNRSNTNPADNPGENLVVKPNPESYGTGYTHGRAVERQHNEINQQVRDESNTANGLLIGILLTGLVVGGSALAYFATQRDRTPAVQRTIVVPSASPSPAPSPQVKERVIERVVPVPQQNSPTVIPAPNIQIEAPKPQQPAPQAETATPSKQPSEPSRTEAPESPEPTPSSPEATASPSPANSGQ
jgi:hypothetical protein